MKQVVKFLLCFLFAMGIGFSYGQEEIKAGKITLENGNSFFIEKFKVMDSIWWIQSNDKMLNNSSNITVLEHYLGNYKISSSPTLFDIVLNSMNRKEASSNFDRKKERLFITVTFDSRTLKIEKVSFHLPMNNKKISLMELDRIRRNIYAKYRPKVIAKSDGYLVYSYLTDDTTIFF
ncbi:hypothetical protein [Sphingobacterium sp. GVS05A]|uniref:hypothetical protein n=1 Tax=Sphingobacterium sp. GVS05A TaxID=2862679 RepID=UPI001CC1AE3C|nr:hypothetical protein [Sphingobacterium sp. GVS05A]